MYRLDKAQIGLSFCVSQLLALAAAVIARVVYTAAFAIGPSPITILNLIFRTETTTLLVKLRIIYFNPTENFCWAWDNGSVFVQN